MTEAEAWRLAAQEAVDSTSCPQHLTAVRGIRCPGVRLGACRDRMRLADVLAVVRK
jgi:hypothetical protein